MSCKRAAARPDCLHAAGWEYFSGGMLRELLMMIALLYFFCCFLRPICFSSTVLPNHAVKTITFTV